MRTNEPSDDDPREHERLDRATDALREAFDSQPAPQAVVGATLARLGTLRVSKPPENRTPLPRRIRFQRIVRVAAAVAIVAALFFWLTTWPSQTSALAQAARNVQAARSVAYTSRAKVVGKAEQVARIEMLGDVVRQRNSGQSFVLLTNFRTGDLLSYNPESRMVGSRGHWMSGPGDPLSKLLGVLKTANERLGDESVKGVACSVFRGRDASPLGISGESDLKIWVDKNLKLPIRVEAHWPNRAGLECLILEDLTWNSGLDPSQFDMEKIAREYGSSVGTAAGHRPEVSRVKPPSFESSPAESRDQSGLRLIGLAIHRYLDRHQQRLVPATVIGPDGKTLHSWRVEILPFLGKGGESLYKEYHLDEPWDSPANKRVLAQMPDVFRSAGDDLRSTNSSFFALVGPGTVFEGKAGIKIDQIFDGTSTTILLVEAKRNIPWTKPEDIPYDPAKPLPALGGFDGDKFLALFANGTVRQLSMRLDERTLKALIGRNDRTVIDLDTLGQ
jgi:hypothetical protein